MFWLCPYGLNISSNSLDLDHSCHCARYIILCQTCSRYLLRTLHYPMTRIQILDQFDFHHSLEETPGIAVVMITGPDCGSCKMMKQALQVLLELGDEFTVYEVDAEQDRGIAEEFGVFHLPSLFVYRDGVYHAPLEVEALPERLIQGIETILALPAMEAP